MDRHVCLYVLYVLPFCQSTKGGLQSQRHDIKGEKMGKEEAKLNSRPLFHHGTEWTSSDDTPTGPSSLCVCVWGGDMGVSSSCYWIMPNVIYPNYPLNRWVKYQLKGLFNVCICSFGTLAGCKDCILCRAGENTCMLLLRIHVMRTGWSEYHPNCPMKLLNGIQEVIPRKEELDGICSQLN